MINSPRVCIQVQSVYIEAQSSPDNERYVFAYTVTIRNLGRAPVQLLGRYWLITNGNGRETEPMAMAVKPKSRAKEWLASSHLSRLAKSPATYRAWRRVPVHQRCNH